MASPQEIYTSIRDELSTVLVGNEAIVEDLTIALLTRGHVLLEGVPGVAKTTIANGFARATGLDANRVQMTPDLLPADIIGTHVYNEPIGEFELHRGPIFSNVIIADEINRATPKTQSALLEAMQEETVTIEGDTLSLPTPFMVVATQNPIEMEGTYELPEAQRDRFQMKATVDLPDESDELHLLDRFDSEPNLGPDDIEQVVNPDSILSARETVSRTYASDAVKEYIRSIVAATRDHPDLNFGGSPRATLSFLRVAKARAAIQDREYLVPEDVKEMAVTVLTHRLAPSTEAQLSDVSTNEIIEEIVSNVTPPSAEAAATPAEAVSEIGGIPENETNQDDR